MILGKYWKIPPVVQGVVHGEDGPVLDALPAGGAGWDAQERHGQGQQEGAPQDCLSTGLDKP